MRLAFPGLRPMRPRESERTNPFGFRKDTGRTTLPSVVGVLESCDMDRERSGPGNRLGGGGAGAELLAASRDSKLYRRLKNAREGDLSSAEAGTRSAIDTVDLLPSCRARA